MTNDDTIYRQEHLPPVNCRSEYVLSRKIPISAALTVLFQQNHWPCAARLHFPLHGVTPSVRALDHTAHTYE